MQKSSPLRVTQAVLDPLEPQDLQARMVCQVWMAVMAILESLVLLVRWVLQVLLDPLGLQALQDQQGLKAKEDDVVSLEGQQHKDYQGGLDQKESLAMWGLQEKKERKGPWAYRALRESWAHEDPQG